MKGKVDTQIGETQLITKLLETMETEVLREQAKRLLQGIITQEIRGILHGDARRILEDLVGDIQRQASQAGETIKRKDILEQVATNVQKQQVITSWDIKDLKDKVAREIAASFKDGPMYQEILQMIRSEKPGIAEWCRGALTSEVNKFLVEQLVYWRGQFEDQQRRISTLELRSAAR